MTFKSSGNSQLSLNDDKIAATSLAELLDARSREYLQHCLKTTPAAERHTIWSRLFAVTQRLKLAVQDGCKSSVSDAIIEIGSNLLGCEEIAVLEFGNNFREPFLAPLGGRTTFWLP